MKSVSMAASIGCKVIREFILLGYKQSTPPPPPPTSATRRRHRGTKTVSNPSLVALSPKGRRTVHREETRGGRLVGRSRRGSSLLATPFIVYFHGTTNRHGALHNPPSLERRNCTFNPPPTTNCRLTFVHTVVGFAIGESQSRSVTTEGGKERIPGRCWAQLNLVCLSMFLLRSSPPPRAR